MKIALFTETYLPTINGVVTHVKSLKEGLEALGHKVLIVTADASVKKHEVANDIMYCPAVRLKKIYNYDVSSPLSPKRHKLIKEFSPDIIHIHNEFGIGMSGILIAKFLKIPLVYTLHTMYEDYIYYVANKHFCKFVTKASYKYAKALAGAADAITGPSKKVEEFFHKCGVKKKISVIANSAEMEVFDPAEFSLEVRLKHRDLLDLKENDIAFCFCGRLGKEKNISWLLKEWAAHVKPDDNLKLIIIGDGPLFSEFNDEITNYNISDTVKLTGRIEHVDLPPYYAACDGYLTASLTEMYSISTLEAMSMELPVFHIRDKLNEGQIIEGVNGCIFDDGAGMYKELIKFRDMSLEERKKFGASARNSIIHSNSVNTAGIILDIYESVIKNYNIKRKKKI